MVTAQQVHLEAAAALLERAYWLALGIEDWSKATQTDEESRKREVLSRELVNVLDEVRAKLLMVNNART